MQKMMAVEAVEKPGLFQFSCFWQVHAPVDVFVCAVVGRNGCECGYRNNPWMG